MGVPIAILSFNRPQLLRQVLESLRVQSASLDDTDVALFQDWSDEHVDLHEDCISTFLSIFPSGLVKRAEKNLGVAVNFERAENWCFLEKDADVAYFFEDDMVLGKHYIQALNAMASIALNDERIAYVSAYGNHRLALSEQRARKDQISVLDHKWAFALTRRQWLRQKPIIDGYLDIVRKQKYSQRDNTAIRSYFASLGYGSEGTSQDAAKDVASCVLGTVKLNSVACYAKYVGKEGLHSNASLYAKMGYDKTEIFDGPVEFSTPTNDQINQIISNSRKHGKSHMNDLARIARNIYGKSPFDGFKPTIDTPDTHGWNGTHGALSRAVLADKPEIIVDLGVWKGQSTITLANAQKDVNPKGYVVAVDTFLGSPEHWSIDRADIHAALKFQNGRPSFYDVFLSNVVLNGMQDRILPIPQTSENAAIIMKKNGIVPNLVHIDAAHEYEPALRDMEIYWDLLAPGGLLMGDDFPWVGVARAVVHFSDRLGIPFSVENPKWWIRKPK